MAEEQGRAIPTRAILARGNMSTHGTWMTTEPFVGADGHGGDGRRHENCAIVDLDWVPTVVPPVRSPAPTREQVIEAISDGLHALLTPSGITVSIEAAADAVLSLFNSPSDRQEGTS